MASHTVLDVQAALQRAKKKICSLQEQISSQGNHSDSPEPTWWPSKELRDSLVDMYRANPRVNVELRHRLPSPVKHSKTTQLGNATSPLSNEVQQRSNTGRGVGTSPTSQLLDWPQAPQHLQDLQEPQTSRSPPPLSQRRSPSPPSSRPPAAPGGMEADAAPGRGSNGADDRESRSPGSPVFRRNPVNADSSPPLQDLRFGPAGRVLSLDRDKNISFLLKELDSLRDINKKLQDQLVQKEKELQRRDVEEELREAQQEARSWERPAAVLEEVLSAQKERDQALMSRLLLANEERDEALLRAQRLLQAAAELENMNLEESDMDVDQLLQCVCTADSVQEVERFGSVLVQHLRSAQQRRHDITAQEMKAVMEERDVSVTRCKRLEQDLVQQRADKEELLRLQRERDSAVEDRQRLEAELQTLLASHSMHCSWSGSSLASQDVPGSQAAPPSVPGDGGSPPGVAGQPAPLLFQLQQLSREKQSVEAELQRCQAAESEARERVQRLERLVEVLRKKVGTGTVRAVI